VTVCIAARCQANEPGNTILFGLSDRMVTAGDIQFQPPARKIVPFTNSIIGMTSDEDTALHGEILQDLTIDITDRVKNEPTKWLDVEFVAELYLKHRNEAKRRRAERDILFPLGLDSQNFITKQHTMSDSFIRQISLDLVNYQMPQMSIIVCGVDTRGHHIYVVHDNDIGCYDGIGFASIGIGARHANSQFMLQGHTPHSSFAETMLLAYLAKKRAEIAPGVGTETDIFFFGPQLGSFNPAIDEALLAKLETEYKKIANSEKQQLVESKLEISSYVKQLQATTPATQQEASKPSGSS